VQSLNKIDQLREHKRELLALLKPHAEIAPVVPSPSAITEAPDPTAGALAILARLKGYTLPFGRMAAARDCRTAAPATGRPRVGPGRRSRRVASHGSRVDRAGRCLRRRVGRSHRAGHRRFP
jgi:hypothetical protein